MCLILPSVFGTSMLSGFPSGPKGSQLVRRSPKKSKGPAP